MLAFFRQWIWRKPLPARSGKKTCVLFLTNSWSEKIAARFQRLEGELGHLADVVVLYDSRDGDVRFGAAKAISFDSRTIERKLKLAFYTPGQLVPGSAHFPLLQFARRYKYEQYWQIEYDVEFTGKWTDLVAAFDKEDADLVASHVRRYDEAPEWFLWPGLEAPRGVEFPMENRIKAFLPIFRISYGALQAVERSHQTGWRGHAEALIPTCLHHNGLRIIDMNSIAPFYKGSEQDPVDDASALSTLRWRPEIDWEREYYRGENLIYHPVK